MGTARHSKYVWQVSWYGDKKILALLHSIDVRHRQLRVGLDYIPPPEDGLDILNFTKDQVMLQYLEHKLWYKVKN